MAEITAKESNEYNYRSLNRKDLMSLQSLSNDDFPIKHFKKMDTKRDWSVNLYNLDIEGSSPRRIGAYNQKIDYTNKNDDIERSNSKTLHMKLNKPEHNLSNEDIEYSMPNCVKIKTKRHLDPLEPKYTLPTSTPVAHLIPKFIRDNIQIDDIDGSHPRKIMSRWFQRDTFKKDDIPNSSPKIPYKRNTFYDSINYKDVTHSDFHTKRMTNPLEPVYYLGYPGGEKMSVGTIDGNKPLVFSKYIIPDPMNLKVDDIDGSNTGSKNKIRKFTGMNFMYSSNDIPGTQSNTYKRGIITKRNLNPLTPKYQYLGRIELKDGVPENNPYGKKTKLEKSYELNNCSKINGKETKEENSKQSSDTVHMNKSVEEQQTKTNQIDQNDNGLFDELPLVQDK